MAAILYRGVATQSPSAVFRDLNPISMPPAMGMFYNAYGISNQQMLC